MDKGWVIVTLDKAALVTGEEKPPVEVNDWHVQPHTHKSQAHTRARTHARSDTRSPLQDSQSRTLQGQKEISTSEIYLKKSTNMGRIQMKVLIPSAKCSPVCRCGLRCRATISLPQPNSIWERWGTYTVWEECIEWIQCVRVCVLLVCHWSTWAMITWVNKAQGYVVVREVGIFACLGVHSTSRQQMISLTCVHELK